MSKKVAALFLLSALLACAQPLASQTRPRRVSETIETGYSESQPREAAARQRPAGVAPVREVERRGGRSLAGTLLRAGVTAAAVGVSVRGRGGCRRSRGINRVGIPRRFPRVGGQ